MHCHQLQRVLACLGLVVARLERRVRQKARQRRGDRVVRIGLRAQRVLRVALFHDEGTGRVDELFQVLDALLAFLLVAVVLDQAAALDRHLHDLLQGQRRGLEAQAVGELHERSQLGAGRAGHLPDRGIQAGAGLLGGIGQLFQRARTDTARRKVDHPHEGGVVRRVLHHAQVGQRVLDLGPLEKAQTAIDPIRHAGVEQRVLDHARLRIGAVQHRHLAARVALGDQVAHLVDQPGGFEAVGTGLEHPHLLAVAGIGPQVLAQPLGVVADQRVGGVEDVAVRAIVLLELDHVCTRNSRSKSAMLPTLAPRNA
jgi:hypothetical protein